MAMNDLLKKIGLIENFKIELPINRSEFIKY
jgi:hypothetical protein